MTVHRVATLNIRHGGTAKRIPQLVAALRALDADALVVTEFRIGLAGNLLVAELASSGYELTHPDIAAAVNGVLIASKAHITVARPIGSALPDRRHLWAADLGWTSIAGVYMPQMKAKLPYWDALLDEAGGSAAPQILIGDFNTGDNMLDRDPGGAPFVGADRIGQLLRAGYTDAWRDKHGDAREYSWFSTTGNGFRVDHAYVREELEPRVIRCEYDHDPRLARATDHSAMILDLEV